MNYHPPPAALRATSRRIVAVAPEKSIAIIHDWFTVLGGAEKVTEALFDAFPQAELFTVFNQQPDAVARISRGQPVHVSGLNKLPLVRRYYKYLLLLAIREVESFDLSRFDTVISASAAIGRGVLTRAGQPHIAYVHSPARYAWDLTHEYLRLHNLDHGLKGALAREMMHHFRLWDQRTVNAVDVLVANSNFVRQRIWKIYRRDSTVIHPPVDVARFSAKRKDGRHFITTSRLVDYKRVDLIVGAFAQRPDLRLIVVGQGPELARLKRLATTNVEFLDHASDEQLATLYAEARAFVFAALEDFGIAPVEAQAAGVPVIAFATGGTAETVTPMPKRQATGILFPEQSVEALLDAIEDFEAAEDKIDPATCRANAARFDTKVFRARIRKLVEHADVLSAPPAVLRQEPAYVLDS